MPQSSRHIPSQKLKYSNSSSSNIAVWYERQHYYTSIQNAATIRMRRVEETDLGAHGDSHGVGEDVDALQHQCPDLRAKFNVLCIMSRQVVPCGLASDGSSQ